MFSVDPTYSRVQGATVVLSVPWEPLRPGPTGGRIQVLDWADDGPAPRVELDDRRLLAQDGLAPDQSDPRFRQQMVYAVLASFLETVDQARGRRLQWRNVWRRRDDPPARVPAVRPLQVIANKKDLANAHFTPGQGLTFGSYKATEDLAAGVFPGQKVYGCLSHDIVNHEAGHALLYELRPLSMEPIGPDALAFHEALGDILAILGHFRLPGLLEAAVTRSGVAIWEPGPFVELAGEFGRATGRRGGDPNAPIDAVRHALTPGTDPTVLSTKLTEPHHRGAVLVAAVFEAFFAAYTQRITPLLRAAGHPVPTPSTQPTAPAAAGPLPGDLVGLVCDQARAAAAMITTMVVRAIDYLPPAGIRFGDFLDAVILADTDLYPEDRDGFRRLFVEACRRRNIHPSTLPGAIDRPTPDYALWEPLPTRQALIMATQELEGSGHGPGRTGRASPQLERAWSTALLEWGRRNAARLGLDADQLEIDGGNAGFRVNENGFPTAVVSARFTQRQTDPVAGLPSRPRRGTPDRGHYRHRRRGRTHSTCRAPTSPRPRCRRIRAAQQIHGAGDPPRLGRPRAASGRPAATRARPGHHLTGAGAPASPGPCGHSRMRRRCGHA